MRDFYILAIDEKDKIEWHEKGCMMKGHIELFHVEAKTLEEAISIVKGKTSKRFLMPMRAKEVEVQKNDR